MRKIFLIYPNATNAFVIEPSSTLAQIKANDLIARLDEKLQSHELSGDSISSLSECMIYAFHTVEDYEVALTIWKNLIF